jgi:hypothetical protein
MSDDGSMTPDNGAPVEVRLPIPPDAKAKIDELSARLSAEMKAQAAAITALNAKVDGMARQVERSHEYGKVVLYHRWLDGNLASAIRAQFVPNTKTAAAGLLEHPGGLSSFSARNYLGRCLGLYGEVTYADLTVINTIRNKFAHPKNDASGELEIFGFDHQDIIEECKKLRFLNTSVMTARIKEPRVPEEVYVNTAEQIAVAFWAMYVLPKTSFVPEPFGDRLAVMP